MAEHTSRVNRYRFLRGLDGRFAARVLTLWLGIAVFQESAADLSAPDTETIRLDVALLQRDLAVLEDDAARHPAEALIVFLGQQSSNPWRIQSVSLSVDGREVLRRAYTEKESEALERGGMDRLTLGGIGAGTHELRAEVQNRDPEGDSGILRSRIAFLQGDRSTIVQILSVGTDPVKLRATRME